MPESPNRIIIITAPSGAGKTSITRHLLNTFHEQLAFSISAATRPKRDHERDGVDYYFISPEEFQQKIREDAFIEWEMVYEGKYYGTLKSEIRRMWQENKIPVLDIDVKGAMRVQRQYPTESLSIFIEPPSMKELERRLNERGTESPESIRARTNKAAYELSFKDQFDIIIVNDDLEKACRKAVRVVGDFISGKTPY